MKTETSDTRSFIERFFLHFLLGAACFVLTAVVVYRGMEIPKTHADGLSAPTISAVTPSGGSGGTTVTITGTNFLPPNSFVAPTSSAGWTTGSLPGTISGSQTAVIGSYVYLFGGFYSVSGGYDSRIFRAPISDPNSWTDMSLTANGSKRLPGALGFSHLAIVGSTVYLFGGYNGTNGWRNVIYSAPVSDPLTWSDTGAHLPGANGDGALAIVGSTIYLFGGYNGTYLNTIWSAPVSDPLTWSDTGSHFSVGIADHQIIVVGNYLYIFTGSSILRAPTSDPTSWTNMTSLTGKTLPGAATAPQVLAIGDRLFLIGGLGLSEIYTALVSDPLTWTDTGRTLPAAFGSNYAQSAVIGNALYIFGGNGSVIYSAPVSHTRSNVLNKSWITDWPTYADPTDVTFGGNSASNIQFQSATTVSVMAPLHASGAVDVVITNNDGQTATSPNGFTYTGPSISSIAPNFGLTAGGDVVTISGANFADPSANSSAVVDSASWSVVSGKTIPPSNGAGFNTAQIAVIGNTMYLFGGHLGIGDQKTIYSASVSDPTTWTDTGKYLPGELDASQLAVIGSDMFLFGGYSTSSYVSVIYHASVSDPTTWTDTGAHLPANIGEAQVAIVGNKLFLYGGSSGGSTCLNTIYSAPTSDPTIWSNTGMTLPQNICASQIAEVGGYVYLFGGNTSDNTGTIISNIYKAPISDPTNWSDTGTNLPGTLAYSQLVVIGNKMFLLGGISNTGAAKNVIYTAPISDPATWTADSNVLPQGLYGSQAAVINNKLYLFGGHGSGGSYVNAIDSVPISQTSINTSNKFWITNWPGYISIAGAMVMNPQYINSESVIAFTPANAAGLGDVILTNPDLQTSTLSNGFTYYASIPRPSPSLGSISPSSAYAGNGSFVLTINGSNFDVTSVIRWNGSDLSTTFVTSTQLTAVVPELNVATSGTASVTVFTPSPGGGTSGSLSFAITSVNQVTVLAAIPSQTSGGEQASSVILTAGTSTDMYVHGTASSHSGCQFLTDVVAKVHMSDVSASCTPDGYSCIAATSTVFTACFPATSGLTANFEVPISLPYYMEPTDTGSPNAGKHWIGTITVKNNTNDTAVINTDAFDVASLVAIDVAASPNYGLIPFGQISNPQTMTFFNKGNRAINASIQASGPMTCHTGSIPAEAVHVSTNPNAAYAQMIALSSTSTVPLTLNLAKRTTGGEPSIQVLSRLQMPAKGLAGSCSNTLTFNAIAQ